MDFSELFDEWEVPFQRIPKGAGYYDQENGGKWVSGFAPSMQCFGIVTTLTYKDANQLQFSPGGVYTRDDRKVYVRLPNVLAIDDRIVYEGLTYRVLERAPYSEYAGFDLFIAKRVDTKGRDPVA